MLILKHCVYIHKRKDNGVVFYVGRCCRNENTRSVGIKKYRRAFDFCQRRPRWFEIAEESGGVDVDIILTSDSKPKTLDKERSLIDELGRELYDNGQLANECRGGAGAPSQFNTLETRLKKSLSKRGAKNSMYGKRGTGLARTVVDLNTNMIFKSVSEAAEKCGYKMKTLYNWLSGHRKNPTSLRFS